MTVRPERAQGLGRGLAALIPQRPTTQPGVSDIPIARIRPNPYQPRQRMDETELASLTASIAEHGVIQPILVSETLDGYELVAGQRRLRAAQAAGLERIPAVIRQVSDPARLELAPAVQLAVAEGRLTEGHARALGGLGPEFQERVLDSVIGQELSVRQTEELVRRLRTPRPTPQTQLPAKRADPDLERVEEDLRRSLGTKVSLARSRRGGRIVIEYYSDEELGRLYERLTGGTA